MLITNCGTVIAEPHAEIHTSHFFALLGAIATDRGT